jgi:class 3 adenylate cyclase/tetratricopeptide (TPR) repeat protein
MTSLNNSHLLSDWLLALGMQAYEPLFLSNDIGFELLPDTTADDLRDIGIHSVGHRRMLLQAIAKLQTTTHQTNKTRNSESNDAITGHHGLAGDAFNATPISAGLSIKPTAHQHRLLTVMFCDLVGSTELSTQLDTEDLQQLLQAYRICLREVIQKHKGYIAQYLGDGVLVYFGYPSTSESDCERALRAALDTLSAVQDLPLVAGVKLQVRLGLATGMVVIGQLVGVGNTEEVGAVGETPNLAARMQSLAPAGGIVASESTRAMVGDLFEFRSLGALQLKGFAQSHTAWEVLSEQKSLSRFRAKRLKGVATPLVGRDVEIGFLRQQFERSRIGRGSVVLLSGDAGTGKSHLVARLQEDIRAGLPQAPLLQCSPDHSDAPLYPLINFITAKAKFHYSDDADVQRQKLVAFALEYDIESENDFYALADLLGFKSLSAEYMMGRSPDDVRECIQTALLRWLHCLVRDNMLVVVEDLHWADPSTMYLLRKFVDELPRQHAMLIATTRPTTHDVLDKGNHINVLHLDRLPEADIRAMVQAIAAPHIISEQTLQLIVERSDGVPIFATELTRSIISKDGFSPFLNDKAIPQSLSEILLVRLDRLQHGRMTVEQASVLGREFEISLLRACTQDLTENTEIALEELLNAQLFVQHAAPNEKLYSFDHALVRDAVYQRMLRGDRERLHAKAAQVLEQQFEASNKVAPHILALHYAESGNLERAVHCWQRAGDLAINQLAHQEAFSSYSRALNLLADMPANNARDEIEFHLCMAIAEPLIAIRGSGSRKLAHLAQRAYDLCISTDHRNHLTSVQYLKWTVMHSSSEMLDLHAVATDIRKFSQDGNEADRLLAHRAMGFTCMIQGKLAIAHEEFDSFLRLFDYEKYAKSVSFQFSSMNDISGAALAMATTCLLRKLPAAANHWRDKALAWAQRSHNHVAICQSLVFSGGFIGGLNNRTDEMMEHMTQAHHFVTKHQLTLWVPYIELSMALSQLISPSSAASTKNHLEQAATSMEILLSQNGPYITVWAVMYARACFFHGHTEHGADVLARIESRVNSGEKWMEAEYLRLLANFQYAQSIIDKPTHLQTLRHALALAHSQGALIFIDAIQLDINDAELTRSSIRKVKIL